MKLTIVLLTVGFLNVSASGLSQNINFSGRAVALETVLSAVEKQSGYVFLYKDIVLKSSRPVSITAKNMSVEKFLAEIFKGQPLLQYKLEGKSIVIFQKTAGSTDADRQLNASVADQVSPPVLLRGIVHDSSRTPLAGATILHKTNKATVTSGADGSFAINVSEGDVLVVSYVGYETREVKITAPLLRDQAATILHVFLSPSVTKLNEVEVTVSTGFQLLNKERATGSFGIVKKEQIERPSTNIAQRLIGQVSGVQARLDVNGDPTFEIRGTSTLSSAAGAAAPLIIVDGFPIQGDFRTINPNNVESITVLKDAASASIWGARSANGVIVITTKSAKKGVPVRVEVSAFTRIGGKFDLDYVNPLATSSETVEYEKRAYPGWLPGANAGTVANAPSSSSLAFIALNEAALGFITTEQRDEILNNLKNLSNKEQIRQHLLANPVTTQVSVNLSGATQRMSNMMSLMYDDNQSNFKGTNNKRFLLNFRNTTSISKFLDVTTGLMVQHTYANNNGVSLADIQGFSPYEMLLNPDGSYADIARYYTPALKRYVPMSRFPYADWTYNPIAEIANRDITSKQLNARFLGGLTLKIIRGLSIDSKIQYELFNTFNRSLNNENTFFVRNLINTSTTWADRNNPNSLLTPNLPKGSILDQNRSQSQSYNFRNQINFNRNFGSDHEVNAIAGSEVSHLQIEGFNNPTAYGYNDDRLVVSPFPNGPGNTPTGTPATLRLNNWMGAAQTFSYLNSFSFQTERFFSIFGNVAYTFKRKYTISGSARTDASNMISEDPAYRFSPFWSAGGAWQLGEEDFFKFKFIDRFTLRATYGKNGNVDKSTSFKPLLSIAPSADIYTGYPTATISSYGNPTLRWEQTGTWNLGADFSMFKNKLFGTINLYNKKGRDLIASITVPSASGTRTNKLNNAEMTNRGIEVELGTNLAVSKSIAWEGSLNFSYNHNQIDQLFITNYLAPYLINAAALDKTFGYAEGENANTLWGYRYTGIVNNQPTLLNGFDANGNEIKGPLLAAPLADGRIVSDNGGTLVAPYTLGFNSSFRMHDFTLSFIITGKFGHVFRRKGFNYPWGGGRLLPNKRLAEVMNGDPSEIVPLPLNSVEPLYVAWSNFTPYMSYLTTNASHMRFQEAMLSYNLKHSLTSKVNIERAQVFIQGNDLATWYANKAGEDPEYPLGTMKPLPKVTFGIKLEL